MDCLGRLGYDTSAALAYLLGGARLAVLPSLVENSPLSLLELIGAHTPFIASTAGHFMPSNPFPQIAWYQFARVDGSVNLLGGVSGLNHWISWLNRWKFGDYP